MHQLGVLKLYNQELDLALNYFKSAVDIHPAYYEIYTQLVNTFASVGRAIEGVAFFQDLVQKHNDVKAIASLSLTHFQAGQVADGKRLYEALFAQDFHDTCGAENDALAAAAAHMRGNGPMHPNATRPMYVEVTDFELVAASEEPHKIPPPTRRRLCYDQSKHHPHLCPPHGLHLQDALLLVAVT